MPDRKVAVIGSGKWATVIAKIIGNNIVNMSGFDPNVKMFVYDEVYNGRKLAGIINETNENVKYLPKTRLPKNVIAEPDVKNACKDADFIVFAVPSDSAEKIFSCVQGKIKKSAVAFSLIKGCVRSKKGGILLISQLMKELLKVEVAVLIGATIVQEVAKGHFSEATLGCRSVSIGYLLKKLVESNNFSITLVHDIEAVEVCGILQHVVACAAGIADGLGFGENTKVTIFRIGLMEIIQFVELFYCGSKLRTCLEGCGLGDLIAACHQGQDKICSEMFVTDFRSLKGLEKEVLNGKKLQGPLIAEQVMVMLEEGKALDKFPLFIAVHNIFKGNIEPVKLINTLQDYPVERLEDSTKLVLKAWQIING